MRTRIQQALLSQPHIPAIKTLTCSAVLVPLVETETGLSIILTQRTAHLNHHAGQICFPGGRCDTQDVSFTMTALRETEEEIGISKEFIEVVGFLENYQTLTGFMITPVVGFIKSGFQLQPDAFEVAEIFELPLAFLLDSANHYQESHEYQGVTRDYYVIPFQKRKIWGATAGILVNFAQRLLSKF
jgi:8-oxo-dGTP pyrophosphatase MutT (NUDIX family)